MSALSFLSRPQTRHFGYWLLPAAVFFILVAITVVAWRWQSGIQTEARELAEIQETAAITSEIRQRLRLHAQFLRSLQAFATANTQQDLNTWHRFAREIDFSGGLAGLFAFAYAPAIKPAELDQFIFATRRQVDRRRFKVFPQPGNQPVAPVIFISPNTPQLQAVIGFDLLSESVRQQAINQSINRRDVAITAPIRLAADLKNTNPGFLMVLALYRQGLPLDTPKQRQLAFSGVALTSYHVDEFLADQKPGKQSNFTLRVFDESLSDPQARVLIYDSDPDLKLRPSTRSSHHEIDFGGRNWVLQFQPRPTQPNQNTVDQPSLILFGGLFASALLALLVFYLTTHRERAEHYARQVTQELRRHRDHLHELVAERTARLDEALHHAQAANHAKSEFLANMSHELRTPMHAILSFSHLGDSRAQAIGEAKLAQYFQRVEQSAKRLLGLIDDLLDLSKLQAGRMELSLRQTDLLNLLNQACAHLESLFLAKKLTIDIRADIASCEIVADPKLIYQVIINLLSNAIKFSPEGAAIHIEIEMADLALGRRIDDRRKQAALVLRIWDHGVGIPEQELERIFDKFEQSSATRNGAGGTGLGLAICRAIVSQHRGTIVATNNTGGGACFTVTLPINRWMGISESND